MHTTLTNTDVAGLRELSSCPALSEHSRELLVRVSGGRPVIAKRPTPDSPAVQQVSALELLQDETHFNALADMAWDCLTQLIATGEYHDHDVPDEPPVCYSIDRADRRELHAQMKSWLKSEPEAMDYYDFPLPRQPRK